MSTRAEPLHGRAVLVTGASKGIGAAIAAAAGAAGAFVVAHHGSDRGGAEAAVAGLAEHRRAVLGADLVDLAAARDLWARAVEATGGIDVLVCNAAVLVDASVDAHDDRWDAALDQSWAVNVRGSLALLREAALHFRERGGGVVIALSSWAAQRGSHDPGLVAYAATKAALKAATQTLAVTEAASGLLAYVIAPGVVRTRMSEVSAEATGGDATLTGSLAMGEWVPPEEIAELVVHLATGRLKHLSGATLDVNGASYIR